ncbi:siderophore ferric iron reductase [Marinobacterium aestuariivivens]|uniref:Siderophore ferric iron reductase n=1 Tax=Marinobacterium aestuariivivens TaxID=1698799 RepID=A0ABW1ZXJ5_9GAMM
MAHTAGLVPALQGRIGRPRSGDIVTGADNSRVIASLLEHLRHHYPEAGHHYWSVRCWGLLIWQPVVLGLAAVHLGGCALRFTNLGQQAGDGIVAGYSLPDQPLQPGSESRLIAQAAYEIRSLGDPLLEQLAGLVRINPVLARRLLADRVLATLLHLQAESQQPDNDALHDLARCWLTALDLDGASDLMSIDRPGGGQRLALDRKGCCQHYRRLDGGLCSTCPRLARAERIERLQLEWSDHAGTE